LVNYSRLKLTKQGIFSQSENIYGQTSQCVVLYSHIGDFDVTKEEKLDKVTRDFSLLPEEKQDYILGVLQALVFAHDMTNEEIVLFGSEQNSEFA